ncbi:MAG: iron chelate uptake ABC transporter family permease subunit [Desulfobulbaceae bacterium]
MNTPIGKKIVLTTFLLGTVLILFSIIAISAGSSGVHFWETLAILAGKTNPDSATATILYQIRLPRVILAAFVGGSLALGGLVFQALLSPDSRLRPTHRQLLGQNRAGTHGLFLRR